MDIDPINENTRYKLDLSGPREQHIKTDEQQGQGRKALPNASRNDKASLPTTRIIRALNQLCPSVI